MSDTIYQECKCCGHHCDCINGLCLTCSTFIEEYTKELQYKIDLLTYEVLRLRTKQNELPQMQPNQA